MGQKWRDCIVTLIDLLGTKELMEQGAASNLMRKLHRLIMEEKKGLLSVAEAYAWNDSVLLLSYVDDEDASFEAAVRDADKLKRRVDELGESYAIAVKGKTFPPVARGANRAWASGVTLIRASSWAMANCFEIEKTLGSKLRKPWYLDGRIARKIHTNQKSQKKKLALLPSKKIRSVYVFDGYLWDRH